MSTTTHTRIEISAATDTASVHVVGAEVLDLFRRIKQLEQADGSWPGADTISLLCVWFTNHVIDPEAPLSLYRSADPSSTADEVDATVYLVQRGTVDGLCLFADERQASEYAELFAGAESGTATVINRSAGAQLIIDSQPCPDCGDQNDCCPCPMGDPGCEAMDCQNHDTCRAPIPAGVQVHLVDEDPDGPHAVIGVVADPTDAETSERRALDEQGPGVLVAWPYHRRWENRANLTRLDDNPDLYR